jgi:hypothetical protein
MSVSRWVVGAAAVSQNQPDHAVTKVVSVSYSLGLGQGANLGISLLAALGEARMMQLLLMLSTPLGPVVQLSQTAQLIRVAGADNRDT